MDVSRYLPATITKSKLVPLLFWKLYDTENLTKPFHCPFCKESAHIHRENVSFSVHYAEHSTHLHIIALIECSNPECQETSIFHENIHLSKRYDAFRDSVKKGLDAIYPEIKSETWYSSVSLHCWLPPQEDIELNRRIDDGKEFIPTKIYNNFIEMQKVASISSTASAILARRLLERIILDKWPEAAEKMGKRTDLPTLNEMIKWLGEENKTDNVQTFRDLKTIGNKITHIFSPTEDVRIGNEEIELIISELDSILSELYIEPNHRKRRQERIHNLMEKSIRESERLKRITQSSSNLSNVTEDVE